MANKKKFYTMHISQDKYKLVEHKGYDDGEFLYYGLNGVWYAIDPLSGVAVINAESAKKARDKVHEPAIKRKLIEFKKTQKYQEYIQAFKELKRGLKK